jgi:hypothetical protein
VQLLHDLDPAVAAERRRGRGPLADAVERQNERAVEGRGVEGARRVAEMVLAEAQPVPVEGRIDLRNSRSSRSFWNSFSRSQSGIAEGTGGKPRGAVER